MMYIISCCVTDSPAPDQCVSELGAYDGLADHEYVCRHGSVPHDVYYLVLQIAQHQISVSQNLARMMGWQIMSTCAAMGVSDMEDTGIASSLILASPDHDR